MKIGVPRALAYYAYYPFIKTFLGKLGLEAVVSSETTKETMDMGIEDTITDACVPLKLFHGHVRDLMNRVDYVLVPRLVSVDGEATFCPKFLGLPDMLISSIPKFKNMLEVRIDLKGSRFELFMICLKFARRFKKGFFKTYNAYRKALFSLKNHIHQFLQGGIPPLGIVGQKKNNPIHLAVLGYPYMLYDPYVNLDLIKRLIDMGVYIITPEMLSEKDKQKQVGKLKKSLFWSFSNDVIRSAYHLFENRNVDGIIHVTAFGCGPDFIVDKLMEIDAKECGMPYLTISLDEHTGREGLNTRLEAFVDMLKIKKARKEATLT